MPLADPNSIVIPADRQRRAKSDIDSLAASIASVGQIHPIVVRREGEALTLVVGERRLLACRKLDRDVEYRLWENLTPGEALVVELEENLKRENLPWRDVVRAYHDIHGELSRTNAGWNVNKTAERISAGVTTVYHNLLIYKHLDSLLIAQAQSAEQAYTLIERQAERRAASIVGEIIETGKQAFAPPAPPPPPVATTQTTVPLENGAQLTVPPQAVAAPPPAPAPPPAVLNADFLSWAPAYSGPKFNLLHVDFPYGVRYEEFAHSVAQRGELYGSERATYFDLLDALCTNLDRIASYSCHMVFWFSMTYYAETKRKLESAGFWVHEHPLVWLKSDNAGIVPGRDAQYLRRIYETAFLASLGKRTLIKAVANAYAAPTVPNAIHPSVKPEPVLRHFFSGLVDETTDLFDPTCGSGSALRAAEDYGARSVFALELNPEFAKTAEALTQRARQMRVLSR